jgi:hypothetical protein
MNNKHLNIAASILAGLAVFGLFKGQVMAFVGLLFLSGMIFGAVRFISLDENKDRVKNIKKDNFKLAGLGMIFGGISLIPFAGVAILGSFGFGICFGLIAVNMIFEKNKNK